MTWLHIARIPGLDGEAWLVVPGAEDRVLGWAIGQIPGVRVLPSFGGWLIPLAGENAMWSAISKTSGLGTICQECLHGGPCMDWIRLVSRRFETASNNAIAIARGPQPRQPGYRQSYSWQQDQRQAPEPERDDPPPRRRQRPPRPAPVVLRESKEQLAAKTLGLTWPAEKSEITKAFRRAVMKAHPDLGGTDAAVKEVIAARDVLLEN